MIKSKHLLTIIFSVLIIAGYGQTVFSAPKNSDMIIYSNDTLSAGQLYNYFIQLLKDNNYTFHTADKENHIIVTDMQKATKWTYVKLSIIIDNNKAKIVSYGSGNSNENFAVKGKNIGSAKFRNDKAAWDEGLKIANEFVTGHGGNLLFNIAQ